MIEIETKITVLELATFTCTFNSYGAIRYLGGSLALYILRAPKYLKTRSIVYFGPLYLDN